LLLLGSDINYKASAFELVFKSILFAFVYGSQTIMMFWFRKSPVFYLPPGWFGPAQRFLSLPFAPAGRKNSDTRFILAYILIVLYRIC
jgi:hypothetical protein